MGEEGLDVSFFVPILLFGYVGLVVFDDIDYV